MTKSGLALPISWEVVTTNDAGIALPWKVAATSDPAPFLSELNKYKYDRGPNPFVEGYREAFGGDPYDKLLWCGLQAGRILSEATFGDRNSTFAMDSKEIARTPTPFDMLHYAFREGLEGVPAALVLHAKAFKRGKHANSSTFYLHRRVPNFDSAVKGLLVVKTG